MNFEEILKTLFGEGNVAVTDVIAIISMILTPIITVFYNRIKNKLINSDFSVTQKDKQIAEQSKKIEALEQGMSYLANMISTAYLSSNTIPAETKKVIGSYAEKLDKVANLDISNDTKKLIDTVSTYVPNIVDKEKEILKATKEVEEVIDTVNEATQNAIDKLKL